MTERCAECDANIALVGIRHRCIPRGKNENVQNMPSSSAARGISGRRQGARQAAGALQAVHEGKAQGRASKKDREGVPKSKGSERSSKRDSPRRGKVGKNKEADKMSAVLLADASESIGRSSQRLHAASDGDVAMPIVSRYGNVDVANDQIRMRGDGERPVRSSDAPAAVLSPESRAPAVTEGEVSQSLRNGIAEAAPRKKGSRDHVRPARVKPKVGRPREADSKDTLTATKPWMREKPKISRATWYRRQREKSK